MSKPVKEEPKKPYVAPVLTIHGTVRELTQSNQVGGALDKGGRGFRVRTAV
jgi:hypothetical protein